MLPARLAGATRSSPVPVVPDRPGDAGLPGEDHGADRRGRPSWEPDRVGDHAGADEHRADDRTVDRAARAAQAARDPGSSVAISWPTIAPTRPKLNIIDRNRCQIGVKQHQAPRQRGEQDVADVGDLHRDRAAVGTAAQAHGNRQHHGDAEDRRRLGEQLVDVHLVADQPVDGVGHDDDGRQPGEREEVDAVGDRPTSRSSPDDASSGSDEVRATWHGHRTSPKKVPVCPPIATPA